MNEIQTAARTMRIFSVSRNLSFRGAGLGNELIPAAKSYLCAQALGAVQIPHSWGLNPRGYRRLIGGTAFDVVPPRLAWTFLPHREITREAWLSERVNDYGELCIRTLERAPFPAWSPMGTLVHSGMWGGCALIDPARFWVWSVLSSAAGASDQMNAFLGETSGAAFRIGVHIRGGDFEAMSGDIKGKFNFAIPRDWYRSVLSRILPVLPAHSVVCVLSAPPIDARDLLPANTQGVQAWFPKYPGHDTADLLALASCDLILCSVSSYSTMAAWLGRKPYIWLRDQMHEHAGRFSIWGQESLQGNWLQAESLAADPGALPSPCIPASLNGSLNLTHLEKIMAEGFSEARQHDPIRYGCTT